MSDVARSLPPLKMEPHTATRASKEAILVRLLLAGSTAEGLTLAGREIGLTGEEVAVISRETSSNPLYSIGREYWTRLQSREWYFAALAKMASDRGTMRRLDVARPAALSRPTFLRNYYYSNRPVLVRGAALKWPAVSKWTEDYLTKKCGNSVVEVMAGRASAPVPAQNTGDRLRKTLKFGDYIRQVYHSGPGNDSYMVSRNHFFERAGTKVLLRDLKRSPYVNTQRAREVRMWFGPSGTVTPLHYDDKNNLIVQVVGRKTIRLYSPWFSEHMAQRRHWYAGCDPRETRYPSDVSLPVELTCDLLVGDALFLPVGWWHAVYSKSISMSLSFFDFGVPNEFERR